MNPKKLLSTLIFFFLLGVTTSVYSQGFTKLQDKYGAPTSEPIQQRAEPTPGSTNPQNPDGQGLPEGMLKLDGDFEIEDLIKQISAVTGRNFILDDKVRGKIKIISESPMPKEMAYQVFLSALQVNGYTTIETPAGLINIVQQKDALSQPTDLFTQDSPNTDKFITRIVQLNNISANDLSQVIKPMISKNGNMFAYPTTNSIVITDTGSNIDHLLKLIRELDQEGPQEVLDIVPIINADAKDIADKITQIFADSGSKDAAGSGAALRNRRLGARGGQQELEDVQSISKVISDERTNSVIVMGTKRAIIKIKALIARLDRALDGIEGSIHVYYLKHANAKELAEVLSSLVQDSATKTAKDAKAKKDTTTVAAELEGGVKVTADDATNSLVITASPKDYTTLIEKVVSKLDIVRPQVYLEAVIMALSTTKTRQLGLNLMGGLTTQLFGENANVFASILPTVTGTGVGTLGSIAAAAGGFSGGVISDRTIDFTTSTGDTVSVPAVSSIIQAIQSDADTNVLSTPSIMTLDNEEAQIQVGQEVPVPSGSTVSSGTTTFNVTREDVGIILKITPQITENNSVNLKIAQEITFVSSNDVNLGPTLDKKTVETVVLANNKQTIVIGGLIADSTVTNREKVPLLGDVPILGNLFKNTKNVKTKSNLLVFITPYIIRERNDYLAILKKKIEERNAFVDLNFAKSEQKIIRKSIQNHAADLLEFKCRKAPDENVCANVSTTNFSNPNSTPVKSNAANTNVRYERGKVKHD